MHNKKVNSYMHKKSDDGTYTIILRKHDVFDYRYLSNLQTKTN